MWAINSHLASGEAGEWRALAVWGSKLLLHKGMAGLEVTDTRTKL